MQVQVNENAIILFGLIEITQVIFYVLIMALIASKIKPQQPVIQEITQPVLVERVFLHGPDDTFIDGGNYVVPGTQ